MTDIVDRKTRSRMMASITGRNTKPEICLRRGLHARGFRFRLHARDLPGKPDLVLPKYNAVIFVNGCFWHRHEDCRYATIPATRVEFWQKKFQDNVKRDRTNIAVLKNLGWRVAIVWECGFKNGRADRTLDAASFWLTSNITDTEYAFCEID